MMMTAANRWNNAFDGVIPHRRASVAEIVLAVIDKRKYAMCRIVQWMVAGRTGTIGVNVQHAVEMERKVVGERVTIQLRGMED